MAASDQVKTVRTVEQSSSEWMQTRAVRRARVILALRRDVLERHDRVVARIRELRAQGLSPPARN